MSAGASVDGQESRGAAVALAWLAHPVTLLCLVLLVVNDHVLKAAYPGPVTGKLSDLAGLVLAPPLVAVGATLVAPPLTARRAAIVGLVTTAAGFIVVKGTAVGAQAASAVWSAVALPSVVRADASDLLALPALLVAMWAWNRARRRPVAHRLVRLARALVLLPAALLAVAATSLEAYPQAVAVVPWRGGLLVGEVNARFLPDGADWEWARYSVDAGRTWRWLDTEEIEAATAEIDWSDAEQTQACVPHDRTVCYRVVRGHLRVEQTLDGGLTWTTSWEVTDEQRQRLARHFPMLGDPAANLSSHSLAVQATERGHVVLVANGRDGYALRGEDGSWQRIGFGDGEDVPTWDDPPPMPGTWIPPGLLWGQVAAVCCAVVTLHAAAARPAGRTRRRPWRLPWWQLPGLGVVGAGLVAQFLTNAHQPFGDAMDYLLAVCATAAGVVAWVAPLAATRILSPWQWWVALPASLIVGFAVSAPLLVLPGHAAAPALAVLVWGVGTTLAAASAWHIGQDGGPARWRVGSYASTPR